MRALYILTASQSSEFLRGQLSFLRARGLKITLSAPEITPALQKLAADEGVEIVLCPMHREISPVADSLSYLGLLRIIWTLRPGLTITVGPKAALVGGLASATCQVPCRIQTKWGIRLETTRGLLRVLLTAADKIASACAHLVLCDSHSARDRTIELGLAPAHKVAVVGAGSANGIDVERFARSPANVAASNNFRATLGATADTPIVGFVGRINRDKGLAEMLSAWPLIQSRHPSAILALIGRDECQTEVEKAQFRQLTTLPGVKALGQQTGLEGIFPAFDVLLLPSHREGFGVVVLEAGACGVPTVGFHVTGMKDSVVSGKTGQLVELGDVNGMADAACQYLADRALRNQHGAYARERVLQHFRREQLWVGYLDTLRAAAEDQGLNTTQIKPALAR